ncbi:unnamed protein product [Dovyalis caffra]|uniref:Uncharacterized protein n=1 Tax=Dovyalis caffra TaxID=77055 RepID=A0AAV1SPH5_9ROSI|nr:unnamed protein product [Dovyalis caffra]
MWALSTVSIGPDLVVADKAPSKLILTEPGFGGIRLAEEGLEVGNRSDGSEAPLNRSTDTDQCPNFFWGCGKVVMSHRKSAETVEITVQVFLHAGYKLFFSFIINAINTANLCNVLTDHEFGGAVCPGMLSITDTNDMERALFTRRVRYPFHPKGPLASFLGFVSNFNKFNTHLNGCTDLDAVHHSQARAVPYTPQSKTRYVQKASSILT